MMQLPVMMQARKIPAKVRFSMVVAVLAAVLTVAALGVAANLAISAAQEMSGLGMASAGAASLIAALSLMVAIHFSRS